ncbi:MacB-like periplasmic core domain containing protein [Desulfovibrio sp. X2]|uniref:ABC transporter permease n=1 Tax=Desulfovibrio sp. X2 TaxID=941449 RepID=UPI0003589E3B|nr:ABC transporter permease [Desulfovibrio sp. X2]EPR36357.1 MacB-like periplasmic core domain containing protein [Desulfovibrio sp. X2]
MSDILLSLRIAARALRVNALRSFLTMLGIIIGIAAVIVMVAVGTGATQRINEQIASIGSNIILILPGSTTSGGLRAGLGSQPTLTLDDAKALRAECPSISLVAPTVRGTAQVVYANMNWSTVIMGATPDMFAIRDWAVTEGRELQSADVDGGLKVCLIGTTVADMLFGSEDPVGRTIRINKIPFQVVGLLQSKGRSPQGTDQDDIIYVPLTTAQRRLFGSAIPNTVGAILVQAKDQSLLDKAQEEAVALLDQRHRIGPAKERDFSVRNLTEILAVARQSAGIMSVLLGSVASISLLVGGIGIMNIMLVSVTERTREIGIRMAIGASQKNILLQFLTEAVLLTMLGGAIGILLGGGGALVVSRLLSWPAVISAQAVVIAVAFSSAIGIFFGFYPARKAAGLNPIDALRYE